MTVLKNDLLLKALRREPVERTPIWIMRQAGRYLPEYRRVRKEAGNFLTLMRTPELATEVTLQPIRRFDLDAAILFSDILTIPDAMGLGLHFVEGEGPKFENPLRNEQQINQLQVPNVEEQLSYVPEAIRLIKKELDGKVPLLGFSGSPWTLATYMIEGGGSRDFLETKKLIFSRPDLAHKLLATNTESVIRYLTCQIRAGADVAMVFDTWGGVLSTPAYQDFSLRYLRKIIDALHKNPETRDTPTILFTKGGGQWLESIASSGCSGVGLDWQTPIGRARQRVGDRVALQGNMDPGILLSNEKAIEQNVMRILADFGMGGGHIFNLGHGINQNVPPEHVELLVNSVHKISALIHGGLG